MLKLLNAFWDLALFRLRPQDLPSSSFLVFVTAACYFAIGVASALLPLDLLPVLFTALLDTLMLALVISGLLYFRRKPERIPQVLSAAYGMLGLLGLIMLPVTAWLLHVVDEPAAALAPALLFWLLYFWSVAALGHVLRHALDIPLLPAVLISYVYFQLWFALVPNLIVAPGAA